MYRFRLLLDNDYYTLDHLCSTELLLKPEDLIVTKTDDEHKYVKGFLLIEGKTNKVIRVSNMAKVRSYIDKQVGLRGVTWRIESLFSTEGVR